jgi:hypothetical protein
MTEIFKMMEGLLKQAEEMKKVIEMKNLQIEKDIEKIEDKNTKDFLRQSLYLARKNKLNLSEFIKNVNEKCQAK